MNRLGIIALATFFFLALAGTAAANTDFNGHPENQTEVAGKYYMISGGKFVNGQTVNGDNASGGVFRFITDDPSWGYATQQWNRDDWFTANAGWAMTLKNQGNVVYDNNGILDGTHGGYYNDAQTSVAGLYMGYSMSNNYDWIYAGYFKLNEATTVDAIYGFFDGTGYSGNLAPNALKYRMNIFSGVDDGGYLMPNNTGSFTGDVFSSDTVGGEFSYGDSGVARVYSGWPEGTEDPIYYLKYELDSPFTLEAGEYFFSHDAQVVPVPAAVWLLGSGLMGLLSLRRKMRK